VQINCDWFAWCVVTAVTLLLLLNDGCKLESLQKDGGPGTKFPQTAGCKAMACFVDFPLFSGFPLCSVVLFQSPANLSPSNFNRVFTTLRTSTASAVNAFTDSSCSETVLCYGSSKTEAQMQMPTASNLRQGLPKSRQLVACTGQQISWQVWLWWGLARIYERVDEGWRKKNRLGGSPIIWKFTDCWSSAQDWRKE